MLYPKNYEWLGRVGTLPVMVTEALKEYGTVETPGTKNNAKIMAWAKEAGLTKTYTADSVPWCGLFMALVCKRAKKAYPTNNPLWALNWAKFGKEAGQPGLGDVLVFVRTGGGHVGIYIGEDKSYYHVLGGNQSDAVTITRIAKNRLYAARRAPFLRFLPASARPYFLGNTGAPITVDER